MSTDAPPHVAAPASGSGRRDLLAWIVLAALALLLFRDHVLRLRTWLGNPDRLNNSLKILEHYVQGYDSGHLGAWNNGELLGYDSFALVHIFPNPLAHLAGILGVDHLFVVDGFVAIALLAVAGISAYAFLRQLVRTRFAAFCGALVYQCSALALLKMSQNDTSFAMFVVIPLALLVVRGLRPERAVRDYVALFLLLAAAFHFMFLQKAAYGMMLIAAYAVYRARARREWFPLVTTAAAMSSAFVVALPRLGGFALTMVNYSRQVPDHDVSRFTRVFDYQNIRWFEILRWFDVTIFGRRPSDAAAFGNHVNLSEGWLLYAGCAATLLAIALLARHRGRWLGLLRGGAGEPRFFVWVMILGMLAVVSKPFIWILYHLFLGIDMTHARMIILSLLPFSLLVALAVEAETGTQPLSASRRDFALCALGVLIALALARLIDMESEFWKGYSGPLFGVHEIHLRKAAVLHAVLTGAVLAILWLLRRSWPATAPKTRVCSMALVGLVLAQAVLFANQRINDSAVRDSPVPFYGGNLYAAPPDAFHRPGEAERRALQTRLQNERYRSVLVCDRDLAGGFCSAHVAAFWGLRLADGYYGTGVPTRLWILPWDTGLSLRSITFTDARRLPWKLLAFLNVRNAVVVEPALYENLPRLAGARDAGEMISRTKILENPYPVVPRAFFARSTERVASPQASAERLFSGDAATDPIAKSYVEGMDGAPALGDGSDIRLEEGPDWMEARFAPSDRPRFIVFNELYFPGWHATVDGAPAAVVPTNAVMRGVPVAPGATRARLDYTTFSRSTLGHALYAAGALVFVLGLWVVRRAARRERGRGR